MEFLFLHGKNPRLSQYELQSVLGDQVRFQSDLFTLADLDKPADQQLMNRLGGTVKICQVFDEHPAELIVRESKTEKIVFGYSQYGGHDRLSDVLLSIKKELKAKGRNARFLNKDYTNISSGQLNKSGLLEKGVDLVRCNFKGQEKWGKTIAFQDIDAYSKRDYDKPKRDMKVGMMPPKLCQMMINFAGPQPGTTIYDPFCGLGSNVMEAVLMGFNVMGSDIKGRLIDSTLKNLHWLKKEFGLDVEIPETSFFQHDATQTFPKKKFPEDLTVVTESYLGPPLLGFPDAKKQTEIFDLLHGINSNFFSGISHIIKKGNRLVMCLPYFRSGKQNVFYPEAFIQEYEATGFSLNHELRSLLYERKNQVVGREVVVFTRR